MRGELTIDVARPPAEVFARLESPEGLLAGVGEVAEVRRTSGRGKAGTTYEATVRAGGREEAATAEVVAHDAPRRIAYEIERKPGTVSLDVRLSPRASGKATRLECSYEIEVSGVVRFVAGPLMKAWLRRNEGRLRDRIRDALEEPPPKGRTRSR